MAAAVTSPVRLPPSARQGQRRTGSKFGVGDCAAQRDAGACEDAPSVPATVGVPPERTRLLLEVALRTVPVPAVCVIEFPPARTGVSVLPVAVAMWRARLVDSSGEPRTCRLGMRRLNMPPVRSWMSSATMRVK